MSRIRALKNRADFRKGGYVDRKKFNTGSVFNPGGDYELRDGVYYHKGSKLVYGTHIATY